jgi:hypothetical protein
MPFFSLTATQYWDAATNNPPIVSGIGQPGTAFIVATPGNTVIDGVTGWAVGDWIVYGLDKWYKFQTSYSQSPVLSALSVLTPTADQIPYFTGPSTADLLTFQQLRAEMELQTAYQSFTRIIHANDYASIDLAFADLGENECLLVSGGQTYPCSVGAITTFPTKFAVRSDNGVKAEIDFSGNAAWQPSGLLQITSGLIGATEEALTSTLTAVTQSTQITSGSAVGQVCTVNTASAHGYTTGDWVFIRYGASAVAGQIAYCTEYGSDEGTALDKPVQVTVISPTSFSYTAYSGTPAATLTIFLYTWKNNQVVQVASTADYAVGDLVMVQSTETYESFTGTQSIPYAELNTVAQIINSTNMMLTEPVAFTYKTTFSAKVTKVTKKTCLWENIKFKGKGPNPGRSGFGQSDMGMLMYLLYRPIMINCEFEACDYISHRNRSNYYPYFRNCISTQTEAAAGGKDTGIIEIQYGWAYGNATRGMLYMDCEAHNGRHGFVESGSNSYPGILYDWTLVRPKAFNQWSNNIDTHGMNFKGRIIDPEIRGGNGIDCRNGSLVCTGIRAYNTKRAFTAVGRVVDVTVGVEIDEGGFAERIYIAPYSDIATPTPDSTNINVLGLRSSSPGTFGVRLVSPNGHKFIAPYIGPIYCVGLLYSPLSLSTTGTGEILAPEVESVTGIDCGPYVVYHDNVSYANFKRVFGRRTGSFTLVGSDTAGATANRYNDVSGISTSGGTVTKFSLNAASVGNFTDSLDYESKTIASGAVTKNFRNVPMTIVDTEGGAASDDLDTVTGLLRGDALSVRISSGARDVNLTNAGNLRQPFPRLLTDSGQIQSYVNNGSQNVTPDYGRILFGSKTYDCPSLAAGASTTTTVTVTGAALGDFVMSVSFGVDTQGLDIEWEVSTTDTVFLRIHNHTGGTIDLASTTVRAIVMKAT